MHTYKATNGTIFHFNSDFSGGCIIYIPGREEAVTIHAPDIVEIAALITERLRDGEE